MFNISLNSTSMENYLDPYDKQRMKMVMLKHEETFKEQVYELHRLYRVQKLLMENRRGHEARNGIRCMKQRDEILEEEIKSDIKKQSVVSVIDESEIELTLGLGPGSYTTRKSKPERQPNSDSGKSLSSSSMGSTNMTCDNPSVKAASEIPEMSLGFHISGSKHGGDIEEQMRQESMKQSPWLLQVLSLNIA